MVTDFPVHRFQSSERSVTGYFKRANRGLVNGQLLALVNGQVQALVNGAGATSPKSNAISKWSVEGISEWIHIPIANGQLQALVNGQLLGW